MDEQIKELSLNEKVNLLISKLPKEEAEEKEVQHWKIPFLTRMKSNVGKKRIEKGWATIIIIRNNRNLQFIRAQVKDGIAIIDGFPRICTADHTLFFKRKPFYIVPEWNLKPFSPEDNMDEAEKLKTAIAGRRAVLATLETEKIKVKKDWGNMVWVIAIIAIVGIGYYFGKQAGWF
jgi:hypothetical protein